MSSRYPMRSAKLKALSKLQTRPEMKQSVADVRQSLEEETVGQNLGFLLRGLLAQNDATELVRLCDIMSQSFRGYCRRQYEPLFQDYIQSNFPAVQLQDLTDTGNWYEAFKSDAFQALLRVTQMIATLFPTSTYLEGNFVELPFSETDSSTFQGNVPQLHADMLSKIAELDLDAVRFEDFPPAVQAFRDENEFYEDIERAQVILDNLVLPAEAEYTLRDEIALVRDLQGRVIAYDVDYEIQVPSEQQGEVDLEIPNTTFSLYADDERLELRGTARLSAAALAQVLYPAFAPIPIRLSNFPFATQARITELAKSEPATLQLV